MKQVGDEVGFFYSGWPMTGEVIQVHENPGPGVGKYVVKPYKLLGARLHFNENDEIIWVQNIIPYMLDSSDEEFERVTKFGGQPQE